MLETFSQFGNRDSQRLCNPLDVSQGDVAFTPFDSADVSAVQAALRSECFLRQPECNPDDLYQNLITESATTYLEKYCSADPDRRARLREMVRETLAEGRLEVACQLHHANILRMSKISRSLRCAIQRRIAAQDFHSLARLLSHFRGRNLLWTNLNDLTDHMIDYLWKLFRLDPATARTIASSPQPGEDDTPSGPHQAFAAFYEELRWVRKNNCKLKRGETMWRHWEYPPFSV